MARKRKARKSGKKTSMQLFPKLAKRKDPFSRSSKKSKSIFS